MWRRYFVVVALVIHFGTVTQSSLVDSENVRVPRQLGVTECCPCDPSTRSAWTNDGKAVDSGSDVRARMLDDCPCRGRGADADGASSILFPNTVSAVRPFLRSEDHKKDLKPLLHPEVDLASSVLNTLKEVTDEDYREALARDAARNAAKSVERDALPEESARNIVTIVVDPNSELNEDDFLAQTSHNQDTRCIHPFERSQSSLKSLKKTQNLLDNLWSPSNANPVPTVAKLIDSDSSVGASNVQQRKSYVPSFKSSSIFKKLFQKKIKEEDMKKKNEDDSIENNLFLSQGRNDINPDSSVSASNIDKRFSENSDNLKDKNHLSEMISRPIKNLLKLRDVELIPKNVLAEKKLATPQKLLPPLDLDALKQKLSQLQLPNLLDKLKRREPTDSQYEKFKSSVIKDSGLAASSIQEQVIGPNENENFVPSTVNPLFLKFNDIKSKRNEGKIDGNTIKENNKDIPNIPNLRMPPKVNITKLKESLHTRLATIPNFLDSLKSQNIGQEDSRSAGSEMNKHVKAKEKNDIIAKIRELREKSRNSLPNISNKKLKPHVTLNNPIIETIPKTKSAENCELDTNERQVAPNDNIIPLETNILDAVPSPSGESTNIIDETGALAEHETEENLPLVSGDVGESAISMTTPRTGGDEIPSYFGINEEEEVSSKESQENENVQKANVDLAEKMDCDIIKDATTNESNVLNDIVSLEQDLEKSDENYPMKRNNDMTAENNIPTELPEKVLRNNLKYLIDNTKNNVKILEKPVIRFASAKEGVEKNDDSFPISKLIDKSVDAQTNSRSGGIVSDRDQNGLENWEEPSKEETKNLHIEKSTQKVDEKEENKSSEDEEDTSCDLRDSSTSSTNEQPVTIEELQRMSNLLLEQSKQKERFSESSEEANLNKSETNDDDDLPLPENRFNTTESPSVANPSEAKANILSFDENIEEDKNNIESTCNSDLVNKKFGKGDNDNDVTPDASENIFNTLASPLRKNIILEPASIGLRNSLSTPQHAVGDILNLNAKLPTLDEIHSGLTNILNPLTRSSALFPKQNIDLIPDPSERRLKSTLPSSFSAEPLEVDVFQMNPPSSSRSSSLLPINLPRINLDTFKTRLAMPDSLGLKPLILESAVGDKRGMVGTSLTFKPDKKKLSKSKSGSLVERLREATNVNKPIGEIPSLEELRNRMRERVESLFSGADNLTPLGSSSMGSISDSLKLKAENTFKNLHNSIAGSLKRAQETGSNILGNAYAKPNNLFEEISQRHEDLTDKLKGIHYDLNDRLTSLHDTIKEKSMLPEFDLLQPKDVIEDLRPKTKTNRMQPSVMSRHINTRKNKENPVSRSSSERIKTSRLKMVPSASVPIPKSIEAPKLMKSQSATAIKPLPRDIKPEIKQQRMTSGKLQQRTKLDESHQPLLKQNTNTKHLISKSDAQQKKPLTALTSKSSLRHADKRIIASHKNPSSNDLLENQDIRESPTEKFTSRFHSSDTNLKNVKSDSRSSPLVSSPKKPSSTALKTPAELRKAFTLPNLSWPKTTENSFLNKVRQALRARMDSAHTKPNLSNKSVGNTMDIKDMERSASTNLEKLPEPIRENAPYKCKMICTRDSTETN